MKLQSQLTWMRWNWNLPSFSQGEDRSCRQPISIIVRRKSFVSVLVRSHSILLDDVNDIPSIPDEDMRDCRTNGQIRTYPVDDLRACKPGEPLVDWIHKTNIDSESWRETHLFLQLDWIEPKVVVQDTQLIVDSSVLVEQILGKEREVLSIPYIIRVAGAEGYSLESGWVERKVDAHPHSHAYHYTRIER